MMPSEETSPDQLRTLYGSAGSRIIALVSEVGIGSLEQHD